MTESARIVAEIEALSRALMQVHKLFLGDERVALEIKLGHQLSPLDFFNRLTQSDEFQWMKPFSSLLSDIDEFIDETKKPKKHLDGSITTPRLATPEDLKKFRSRVEFTLLDPNSRVALKYKAHLAQNPDLVMAHAELRQALGPLPTND